MGSKSILAALLCVLLTTAAALAQSGPADSNIKAALYDIDKAEQQIKGLTPQRKANIKRLQNSLSITEDRLQASTNKDDPSWIEANDRLQALKAAVSQLASGGTSSTPSASAGESATDPTLRRIQSELTLINKQTSSLKPGDHGVAARHIVDTMRVGQELAAYPTERTRPGTRRWFSTARSTIT